MAKGQAKKNDAFKVLDPVKRDDMNKELTKLRAGKGGGVSKYAPVGDAAEKIVDADTALPLEGTQTEVQGVRGYMSRIYGDKYKVTSALKEGNSGDKNAIYRIFVSLNTNGESEEADEEAEEDEKKAKAKA